MADIQGLADEINNDPLGRGYSSMTDQEVANDLNTSYRTFYVQVSSRELLVWAGLNKRFKNIDAARTDSNVSEDIQNICEIAIRLIERDDAAYDPNDSRHTNMVGSLVAANIIAQSDADALNGLGQRSQTRAEELSLLGASPEIGHAHVSQARSL